jgi:hypothetical protein
MFVYFQTPIKDLEIMIMSEKLERNFYRALHLLFRSTTTSTAIVFSSHRMTIVSIRLAFVDDLNEYSFSFGMYLPPMVRDTIFEFEHHDVLLDEI